MNAHISRVFGQPTADLVFRFRSAYDSAEFAVIAARATVSSLRCAADVKGWDLTEEEHHAIRCAEVGVKEAERALGEQRERCEANGVIINAHLALVLL